MNTGQIESLLGAFPNEINYIWQGILQANPSVLISSYLVGILPNGLFPWKWSLAVSQVPYNKQLTNLAILRNTGEYWPLVVFAWTLLCPVRTATTLTLGQYSPLQPSCLVSKSFIFREETTSALYPIHTN